MKGVWKVYCFHLNIKNIIVVFIEFISFSTFGTQVKYYLEIDHS